MKQDLPLDLAALRKTAEAAIAPCRECDGTGVRRWNKSQTNSCSRCFGTGKLGPSLGFKAKATPAVVLSLLDRIKELEAKNEQLDQALGYACAVVKAYKDGKVTKGTLGRVVVDASQES